MTSTLHAPIPLAMPASAGFQRRRGLDAAAERLGLALLAWAHRRRATTRRTIDLDRVRRIDRPARPFC